MPKRHGLALDPDQGIPVFHFGIMNVFRQFIPFGLATATLPEARTIAEDRQGLDDHFRHAGTRLIRSLDGVQRRSSQAQRDFDAGAENQDLFTMFENNSDLAMCLDMVLHYLAIVGDSVGRLVGRIVHSIELSPTDLAAHVVVADASSREISFYTTHAALHAVRKRAQQNPNLRALKEVLEQIDVVDSWWDRAFRGGGEGVRQRVVHYPDLVSIQGSSGPGDPTCKVQAFLNDTSHKRPPVDLLVELKAIMSDFCNWLDGMERETSLLLGLSLSPAPWRIGVPASKEVRPTPEDFLYLPLVDGQGPLPAMLPRRMVGQSSSSPSPLPTR